MEIELKLLIEPDDTAAFRSHPLLARHAFARPKKKKMTGTYFDTPELEFRQSDAGLRVRRVDETFVQTMKGGGGVSGGLHRRHEWESVIQSSTPDLAALRKIVDADSPWGRLLRTADLEQRLIPIFTATVTRTIWHLRLGNGSEIECVLDQGVLEHDGKSEQISEIELELISGEPVHLIEFALALLEDLPLRISNRSKAERGYALFRPPAAKAVRAGLLELSGDMTVETAFVAIVQDCMAQVQANEQGLAGGDADALHQMRVGLRRLRSAEKLFRAVLPLPADLLDDIRWLAATLGAARDLDVLGGSTLARLQGILPETIRLTDLAAAIESEAKDKHAAAAAAVLSPRYAKLMLRLTAWLAAKTWRQTPAEAAEEVFDAPVTPQARRMLCAAHEKLLKRGRHFRRLDTGRRHQVRIAAKQARYAAEFFGSLFPKKRTRAYRKRLTALQKHLGRLNDVSTAEHLLRDLQDRHAGLAADIAFVRGYLAATAAGNTAASWKRWKKIRKTDLPGGS